MFYVPQLTNTLISMLKLTKDLNCSTTSFSFYCVFQDLATRKTILIVKEQSEFYLLEPKDQNETKPTSNIRHMSKFPNMASS